MDRPLHVETQCFVDDLQCNDVYIPSTRTTKPECRCRDGHYRALNGTCLPHTACGLGEGVIRLGTHISDTICEVCGKYFTSHSISTTERCTLIESLHSHPRNQKPTAGSDIIVGSTRLETTTRLTTIKSSSTEKEDSIRLYISVTVGVLLVLLVFIIACVVCRRKKSNSVGQNCDEGVPLKEISDGKDDTFRSKRFQSVEAAFETNETPERITQNKIHKQLMKSMENMRKKSSSSTVSNDEDAPTSSESCLIPSSRGRNDSSEINSVFYRTTHDEEIELEKKNQKKLLSYFNAVANSPNYCFKDDDANVLKNTHNISLQSNQASETSGLLLYHVIKAGFDQSKIDTKAVVQHFKTINLHRIVLELEEMFDTDSG